MGSPMGTVQVRLHQADSPTAPSGAAVRTCRGRRLLAAVAAGLVSTVVVAGCGSSGSNAPVPNGVEKLPAAKILSTSISAAEKATSVHVSGTAPGGARLDLKLSRDSTDAVVTSGGTSLEIIHVKGAYYLKADAAFWTAAHVAAAATLAGKYVKVSSAAADQFKQFTDISTLFGSLKPSGTISKGPTASVNGTKGVALVDSKNSSILYVSMFDRPYPLQILQSGASGGTVNFTDWNKPVSVAVPPKSQVVDLTAATG
jgi:hypothetical protein